MDLTDLVTIRQILREYQTFAQKRLGQHFLINRSVLTQIIQAAQVNDQDEILEIGPGLGTLTRELALSANRVIAVEKDPIMAKACRSLNSDLTNIRIIESNALTLDNLFFQEYFPDRKYKLVSNLPYYLTSAIIRFFLESAYRPAMMVLMVQKEVAERIVATPPEANILSVAVQFYSHPEIIAIIPKQDFWPIPKVDSAIIRITPHKKLPATVDEKKFFRIVKAGFGERRKQIHNSLAGGLNLDVDTIKNILTVSGIASDRRAQTLNLQEWLKLYRDIIKL
ncbi:MAG: 16S rRNA (adenine(1518)-N(6)/adenine(1519)-N(6))-dimethyltransferase RsmA [Patescibacteria group bacterium]